jgi:hypothetical protein
VGRGHALAESIRALELFPYPAGQVLAIALPWWELAAGVLLLVRLWEYAAAAFSTTLFASFAVVTALSWARGRGLDCGCFGDGVLSTSPALHGAIVILGLGCSIAALCTAVRRSRRASAPTDTKPKPLDVPCKSAL